MSTRAIIAVENRVGEYDAIYTRYDGYPSHHGPILVNNYGDSVLAKDLVMFGGMEHLYPKLADCSPTWEPDKKKTEHCSDLIAVYKLATACSANYLYVLYSNALGWRYTTVTNQDMDGLKSLEAEIYAINRHGNC